MPGESAGRAASLEGAGINRRQALLLGPQRGGVTPPAILGERLAAARRAGLRFDDAWPAALTEAVNAASWEREQWLEALLGTVKAWRAGWERRAATRPERALLALVTPGGTRLPERACAHCQREIPPERGKRGARPLYCSYRCARRAAYQRERERERAAA
jgi:hypothetical protein